MKLFLGLVLYAAAKVLAQFPTIVPNLTTISSPVDPSIKISYKVPNGACTTAFDTQEQYTGWVNVPGDYPTNLFFWFVGAREPSSILTIWLNGGPGSSSMFGFFTETGPCEVVDSAAEDKYVTIAKEWGWDRASNMLFIDQPNQVGFSYDTPTNGSLDLLTNNIYSPPERRPNSRTPMVFLNGTFSSLNANHTANTTETAAAAVWHMLQGFLGAFPQFNPPDNGSLGVNLFSESYGGKYGPVFASKWKDMNAARANGTVSNSTTLDIHLTALGIVNGCVDDLIQAPYYPVMAVDNSYGLVTINSIRAQMANASFYKEGGCQDLIRQCRAAVSTRDVANSGAVSSVNDLCNRAYTNCLTNVVQPYSDAGRSVYDIAALLPDSFPPSRYLSYLNSASFQSAIGTTMNYTETNTQVVAAFLATGDYERQALIPELASLLDAGIRVGFMYGDRDYICNWLGGEAVSLSVASAASTSSYSSSFPDAGYAPIIVNESYIGGVVRQFGNLSFSRIYQAGHFVPAYQPETAFQVFARIIMGTSVSDGKPIDLSSYNTSGPANAMSKLDLPPSPTPTCWLRNIPGSCSEEQQNQLLSGEAAKDWSSVNILNGALVTGTETLPISTVISTATETEPLTGLFTATSTPRSAASSLGVDGSLLRVVGLLWVSSVMPLLYVY
ncbi:serine carboxypeptidase [Pseudomassariella vexata]|uniref:Carboxypeptidase n=1 Tax=Pseudomassariella vexata TaxID=1141098 RepID=A0A1Y2DQ02_9PEZI|nr:serine carboxypeptidase [Pseudomassariella vexata]ORY61373.1 serine carboxypeptidase [Pseudomassariella vexata]